MNIVLDGVTPETVAAEMARAGLPGQQRLRVVIEPIDPTETAWDDYVRAAVADGLADAAAGRIIDGDEVFRELEADYGRP